MDDAAIRELLQRLGIIERTAVRYRQGIVTDDNPLAVALGGSDVPFVDLRALAPVHVGDAVAVLTFGNDALVLGAVARPGPPEVSSLPSDPRDGQEVLLLVGERRWHLCYDETNTRWRFLGGASMHSGPTGSISMNTTTPTAPGSGPSITSPAAGVFTLKFGAYLEVTAGGGQTVLAQVYKNAASTGWQIGAKAGGASTSWSGTVTLAAGDALDFRLWGDTGSIAYFGNQFWVELLPVYLTA